MLFKLLARSVPKSARYMQTGARMEIPGTREGSQENGKNI